MINYARCRACKSKKIYSFLHLGDQPAANRFLRPDQLNEKEPVFPLVAFACLDCGLVQVPNQLPSDFFVHYLYVPSVSSTMHDHFSAFAKKIKDEFRDKSDELVVDIGCNDGLFLNYCNAEDMRTVGIEPASNLAELARQKSVEVVNEYFSPEIAQGVKDRYGAAKVIVTTNTFNHIDDLHEFTRGVAALLAPNGIFIIEVPWSVDMIQNNEFDTIYHEHLSVFSVKSLVDLFHFFDMEIFNIERLHIHGGSMRVYSQPKFGGRTVSHVVSDWLMQESKEKFSLESTYDAFKKRVEENKETFMSLLEGLKCSGKKLAGYGAPAKGTTLLNYYGIGSDLLSFLADKNRLKQGLYSPGTHIPIVSTERIITDMPDYLLILAWNFSEEIINQESQYRQRGGQFITPIPQPEIVQL